MDQYTAPPLPVVPCPPGSTMHRGGHRPPPHYHHRQGGFPVVVHRQTPSRQQPHPPSVMVTTAPPLIPFNPPPHHHQQQHHLHHQHHRGMMHPRAGPSSMSRQYQHHIQQQHHIIQQQQHQQQQQHRPPPPLAPPPHAHLQRIPQSRPATAAAAIPPPMVNDGTIQKSKKPTKTQDPTPNTCTCKMSRCLKLYCECFAAQAVCRDSCKCMDCHNTPVHTAEREQARREITLKNPHAFEKGRTCKCSKTGCLKKYCECFKAGALCGDQCQCGDSCRNYAGSQALIEVCRNRKDKAGLSAAMEAALQVWRKRDGKDDKDGEDGIEDPAPDHAHSSSVPPTTRATRTTATFEHTFMSSPYLHRRSHSEPQHSNRIYAYRSTQPVHYAASPQHRHRRQHSDPIVYSSPSHPGNPPPRYTFRNWSPPANAAPMECEGPSGAQHNGEDCYRGEMKNVAATTPRAVRSLGLKSPPHSERKRSQSPKHVTPPPPVEEELASSLQERRHPQPVDDAGLQALAAAVESIEEARPTGGNSYPIISSLEGSKKEGSPSSSHLPALVSLASSSSSSDEQEQKALTHCSTGDMAQITHLPPSSHECPPSYTHYSYPYYDPRPTAPPMQDLHSAPEQSSMAKRPFSYPPPHPGGVEQASSIGPLKKRRFKKDISESLSVPRSKALLEF
mmetsp:Transcript_18524/g.50630  ORF Transcript_18524/g.50630 Transcript_18524/m.50630 type:complete len:673 (+) Transcript_18524:29-2047(+)